MQDWGERSDRWTGIRTEWIDIQGTAVRTLRAAAAPGAEDATPIVLVHGLGGSATNWLEVMGGLRSRGPVLAMDLPGFGETEPPRATAPRVTANARFVPALCRSLGWDRVVLMGNSMGGMISTLVAGRHPELVEALVLVNPGLPAPLSAAHKAPKMALLTFAPFLVPGVGERAMRLRYKRTSAEELAAQTRRIVFADPDRCSPAMRDLGVEQAARGKELDWRLPSFVTAAESLMGLLVGPGRRRANAAVEAIQSPTLLLWGDEDQLVGEQVIQGLVGRRSDWQQHTFDTVGHVPMMEVPDDFLEVAGGFLDRAPLAEPLAS
jgi:pimeloyl-ACP methyl ester carboxylesterase